MSIVVSDLWATASTVDRNELVRKAISSEGLDMEDPETVQWALDGFDETINRLNTKLFQFNLVDANGLTLTANSPEVALPTGFYKHVTVKYTETSSNKDSQPLNYIDWYTYEQQYGEQRASPSCPTLFSTRNAHTEGKLYLAPRPSADFATQHTLDITYFRRIPKLSEASTLNVPAELEPVLLNGAKKELAKQIHGTSSNEWLGYDREFRECWEELQKIDRHQVGHRMRMRLYRWTNPNRLRNTGLWY